MSPLAPRFLLLCVAAWTAALLSWSVLPASRSLLFEEDGVVEWLTALLMLACAFLGTWLLARRGFRPLLHALVPLIGLVGFLDEISFGTRLLGVEPPRFHHVNIDGVHDVIDLGYQLATRHLPPGVVVLVLALLVAGIAALLWRWRSAILDLWRRHEIVPPLVLACLLLVPATAVDIHVLPGGPFLNLIEEMLEATVAGILLYAAFRVGRVRPAVTAGGASPAADA